MRDYSTVAATLFLLLSVVLTGCPSGTGEDAGPGDGGVGTGFDDHTVRFIPDRDAFFDLARTGTALDALKIVVTEFDDPGARAVRYYDSNFYSLHDEWYWFQLLNGERVPGDEETTPFSGNFTSIPEIYEWAEERRDTLPLDLRFVSGGERLYSPRFYSLALGQSPRTFGAATLIYVPPREDRDELWAFELEYSDAISHAELVTFIDVLRSTLPETLADALRWLVRSPSQEALAQDMEQGTLTYYERIVRYDAITVPGETEVYAEGLTAGRLKLVAPGEPGLDDSTKNTILVLGDVPDYLPPAAALITAVPQTPLAHINVLAKNRGIPNAYLGGVLDDPNLEQLARVNAPVIVKAISPDQLDIVAITEAEYAQWRSLNLPPSIDIPVVDLSAAPYLVDLTGLDFALADDLRPLVGGKATGFTALAYSDAHTPDWPAAISARAYAEHMAPLNQRLANMLGAVDFRGDAQVRALVLDGEDAYRARHDDVAADDFITAFLASHDADNVLGAFVRGGGVVGTIRDQSIPSALLSTLEDALAEHFAPLSPAQGLRFRSSATIEDIDGFNGAGLYTSNTGFLSPPDGEHRSVAHALKSTWSSYWGSEAYEERALSNINHLLGHMAILVHARFDDDDEVSNGVFTLTVLPGGFEGSETSAVMEMNAQAGAISVTNPPPGQNTLPEVVRLARDDTGTTITRLGNSNQIPEEQTVLDDAKLLDIFFDAESITRSWLDAINVPLLGAQRQRTLTLDFEYREMGVGWPALANGNNFGQRLIIKQARTLSPTTTHLSADIRALPFPRDVLARAKQIDDRSCVSSSIRIDLVEVLTDPLSPPDLGHSESAFVGYLTVRALTDLPDLGLSAGDAITTVHSQYAEQHHPRIEAGEEDWDLAVTLKPQYVATYGIEDISISDAAVTLVGPTGTESASLVGCDRSLVYAAPASFLEALLEARDDDTP